MLVCGSEHTGVTIINTANSSNFEFVVGTLPYPDVFLICSNLTILEGCSGIVKVVPEDYALELSIFVIQQLALHKSWVEFREWSIGFISTSLSMSQKKCPLNLRE